MAHTKADVNPIGVQKYLKGMNYPAQKDELLETARNNGAPKEVIDTLQGLPGDRFDGPDDVMRAYGREHR